MSHTHVTRLELERHHAGELDHAAAEAHAEHLESCADCRELAAHLSSEREDFERRIPLVRFEAGIRGKLAPAERPSRRWRTALLPLAALAAALLLVIRAPTDVETQPRNRTKGVAGVTLRIAGSDGVQRSAEGATESLAHGDRVRLGVDPGAHRFALALSIDEAGEVTPLVPDSGESARLSGGAATTWLPEAWEFTGPGAEVVVVVLTDAPLSVAEAREAARGAYAAAGGNVRKLPPLALPGAQFRQLLLKP